ncbi:MAG TPA: magnesium transporter [Planctomycetes bacterium]|nr:magnesium transporter [Planctomycetota bacterium]HIJ71200.1 magnesium transporter [Planctomycetota bacterium]
MAQEQKQLLEQIEELLADQTQSTPVALKNLLSEKRSSDIAEVVELLDNDQRRAVFDVLQKPVSAEVLEKVDGATRAGLFELLKPDEFADLISELDADDAADLLAELPENESREVLEHLTEEEAKQIKYLMSYLEDSAGGIMDPHVVSVSEDATVAEAISEIRAAEIDEDFYSVFVVNRIGQFLGDVRIRSLITVPENTKIKQLIDTDTISVKLDTDQEEVRNIFSKNDLIVVPVLDENNKLVGRITADRIIEVAEEEAAEDIYAMAGTDAAELENISSLHAAGVRMTWLLPCLLGTAVTAVVVLLFKNVFIEAGHLAIFLTVFAFTPMIAAISGNAGLQTSAIVVSGLATGDLAALRLGQVFAREVRVALFVALACGVVGGFICALLPNLINTSALAGSTGTTAVVPIGLAQHMRIVFAFGTAMFSAIMVATTLGLFLPFLFRRIGIDPAISSGPLVTTANDSISVAIYLALALLLTQ